MRQFLRGFSTLRSFTLVYLVPPPLVALIRWAITGNMHPGAMDGLYVLVGVLTMHALLRRRFGSEEMPSI